MSKVIQTVEELDAVLHWRRKHAQVARALDAAKAREDALQQRLTAADEQIDLLTPRHTEQPEGKRERFEKWVMATKHPVFGFLDSRSLARGDDRTGYADEYVQGLWVAYLEFSAEQPAPVAVVLAEAREWLGDGKHSDGMAREHWTPEYAALIDRIDATLRK